MGYNWNTWGGADFKFATRIGTIPERKCPMKGKYISLFLPLSANGPERNVIIHFVSTINPILSYKNLSKNIRVDYFNIDTYQGIGIW